MNRTKPPPAPGRTTPTIRDVARHAGVSAATVSNVLSGQRSVGSGSRALVMQAAAALGYTSNHMASSLRRGHTKTIGIVVPNLANEFFSRLVRYWETLAAQAGYEIMVVASQDHVATETQRIQSVAARRVDGLLVAAAQDDFGAADGLPADLPPTVLVDRACGHKAFDTIASDNIEAGRLGARHLLALGHRDIAVLTSASTHLHLRNRIEGCRQVMAEAGLADRMRVIQGGHSVEECRSAIEQELRRPDRPTAIFATIFFATLGAIKAIQALNIAFPDDVSLVAFEHSDWMTVFRPYLTSVSQQSDELASTSWKALMERIETPERAPRHIEIPVRLTVRESARPLAARRVPDAAVS